MIRLVTLVAFLLAAMTAHPRAQEEDAAIRIALLAHINARIIAECGYAKGTRYEAMLASITETLRAHLSTETFDGTRQAAAMMDLTCSEDNEHVKRMLRAVENFNGKAARKP